MDQYSRWNILPPVYCIIRESTVKIQPSHANETIRRCMHSVSATSTGGGLWVKYPHRVCSTRHSG